MNVAFGSLEAFHCAQTGADVVAGDRACRVLIAVLEGQRVITELMAATGLSRSVVHLGLCELRGLGIIDWTAGTQGTIHPTARLVA